MLVYNHLSDQHIAAKLVQHSISLFLSCCSSLTVTAESSENIIASTRNLRNWESKIQITRMNKNRRKSKLPEEKALGEVHLNEVKLSDGLNHQFIELNRIISDLSVVLSLIKTVHKTKKLLRLVSTKLKQPWCTTNPLISMPFTTLLVIELLIQVSKEWLLKNKVRCVPWLVIVSLCLDEASPKTLKLIVIKATLAIDKYYLHQMLIKNPTYSIWREIILQVKETKKKLKKMMIYGKLEISKCLMLRKIMNQNHWLIVKISKVQCLDRAI